MNEKAKKLFKNLNYTISANFLVLGISVLVNLIVPKFIGLKEYSLWQLYVFYSGYVGFFHFGWLDGIYLKIGGAEYEELDKRNLGSQLWYFIIFQSLLAVLLILFTILFVSSENKSVILLLTAIILVVSNVRTYILYIFQSTNRIKEYARLSRDDRYIYFFGVLMYLFCRGNNYVILIVIDIFSKIIVTGFGINKIKDMFFSPPMKLKSLVLEIIDNIKIGSNLMISNVASMLIIGISRLLVEKQWDVKTFGKLSFTLSISNMFMTFINAVGVVMFPLLRRTEQEGIRKLYINLRNLFVPFTFGILVVFNPIKLFLEYWLPAYRESFIFMAILFPMIVYEGRMALLVSTYLKTIREEKIILVSNLMALVMSTIGSLVSSSIVKDIYLTIGVIMFSLAFRCLLAEILLLKKMKLSQKRSIIFEVILTVVFIAGNLNFSTQMSFICYFIIFMIYILINSSDIKNSSKELFDMLRE